MTLTKCHMIFLLNTWINQYILFIGSTKIQIYKIQKKGS